MSIRAVSSESFWFFFNLLAKYACNYAWLLLMRRDDLDILLLRLSAGLGIYNSRALIKCDYYEFTWFIHIRND